MPIFKLQNSKLVSIGNRKISREYEVQTITENNLELLFGLKFVSGSLNKEFSVKVYEQEFFIDTLAFNEQQKSLVIIEYKKDKSFSIIDQGFAYLSAMLNNQAEFVLEVNGKLNKNFRKNDIDWEQSRIIFISNEFTNYQKNAINYKDLPIFLYEVKLYDNNLIEYDSIEPYKTTVSINSLSKNKIIQKVTKKVKVYSIEDLVKPNWGLTQELFELLRKEILSLGQVKESIAKYYIAYKIFKNGQWYNFVELVPQANGFLIFLDIKVGDLDDHQKIASDCSKVGHWATGNTKFKISNPKDLFYAMRLILQSSNSIVG